MATCVPATAKSFELLYLGRVIKQLPMKIQDHIDLARKGQFKSLKQEVRLSSFSHCSNSGCDIMISIKP